MVSSIKLFGQLAPAVRPTVIGRCGQPVLGGDLRLRVQVVVDDPRARLQAAGVADEIGGQLRLAHLREVRGVGADCTRR